MPSTPARAISRRVVYLVGAILLLVLTFILTACINLRSEEVNERAGDEPVATPELTPAGSGIPSSLVSSVLAIRHVDDQDQLLGSAVVLTTDGLLLTSLDVINDAVEVVLPDGSHHRPALVSIDASAGLALLQVPERDLTPIEMSSSRPSQGTEIFATGFDGSPGDLGRMTGTVVSTSEAADDHDYRIRGAVAYETDMHIVDGFLGGALSDGDGGFCGIVVPGNSQDAGDALHVVSQWYVLAWLEHREQRLDDLRAELASWLTIELPGDLLIQHPEGWITDVQTASDDTYRAELTPADPDAPLQLGISVEANDYGSDPDEFIDQVFGDRTSARIWSVAEEQGRPLVRASVSQEGALVDVAYLLDDEFLVAISLRSGYQPESDHMQVEQARALFDVVIESIDEM